MAKTSAAKKKESPSPTTSAAGQERRTTRSMSRSRTDPVAGGGGGISPMTTKRSSLSSSSSTGNYILEPEIILRLINLIHICYAPLTKVEESFNLQATHDVLFHRLRLYRYDHLDFPGVVPRTFIGPLVLGILSAPMVLISQLFWSKVAAQIIVRLCLCELVIQGLQKFRKVISKEFGSSTGFWFVLITGSQFHFMFYMGRTLPNVLALPGVFYTFYYWMKGNHKKFIAGAALSTIIFRSELALLFGFLLLIELAHKRITIFKAFQYSLLAGLLSLALTVGIDSLFWQRLVWPEGEVFWFNTFLNKSSAWGTQPFLWYFYSALPRSLLSTIFLLPVGLVVNSRVRILAYVAILFIAAFSLLPHKELRFIFYVLPLLNVVAAAGADYWWIRRGKSFLHALGAVALVFHLVLNAVLTTGLLYVSSQNYPGGQALLALQEIRNLSEPVTVHIDVYSAETGVSRFLEQSKKWSYDKTENLSTATQLAPYDYLLVGADNKNTYYKTLDVLLAIEGFTGIDFSYSRVPPIKIKLEPRVFVLQKKKRPTPGHLPGGDILL